MLEETQITKSTGAMNEEDFKAITAKGFVRQSDGSYAKPKRIVENFREAQSPDVKQALLDAPVESVQRKTLYTGRVSICITSYRRRLCDPDALVGKWFLDAARYSLLIREDDAASITYSISQIKVRTKEEEGTEVLITPIDVDN